ncbi:hypothetical protein ANN_01654 [Periplaneta americana]|uniref:Uncharacterized protein n=1 Tax=Periplaneta americana TaxID=6978 RepID=A0ABQ8TU44_PERAM|nr:hypothetical protein ANN_01654 [Periplaneta americana]
MERTVRYLKVRSEPDLLSEKGYRTRENISTGSLVKKKLSTEGCTGKNSERRNSSRQKKISDGKQQEALTYGSFTKTKRKAEIEKMKYAEFAVKDLSLGRKDTKLHNAELHALYSSPNIIRNIKSRCLRWAGDVTHLWNPEMHTEWVFKGSICTFYTHGANFGRKRYISVCKDNLRVLQILLDGHTTGIEIRKFLQQNGSLIAPRLIEEVSMDRVMPFGFI